MIYLEIIISAFAAAASIAAGLYTLIKKTRSAASIAVSAAALATALIFIIIALHLADGALIGSILVKKAHLSLLLIVSALFMVFAIFHPYLKPWRPAVAALMTLPGCALAVITLVTEHVVTRDAGGGTGEHRTLYIAGLFFYLLATPAITAYKSFLYENRALRTDLRYISAVSLLLFAILAALSVFLPGLYGIDRFLAAGTACTLLPALMLFAHGAVDSKNADMRRFFMTALYWLIISAILVIPVSLLLKYNNALYVDDPLPVPGVALFIFAYLFLVFKYLRLRIETVFQKGYRDLVSRVDLLFGRQFSAGPGGKPAWEQFQKILIDGMAEQFKISGAYLFLYRSDENIFRLAHGSDEKITDHEIDGTSPLPVMLDREHGIIYRHALPFSLESRENPAEMEPIFEFFERNRIETILPFYGHEGRIIGLLALGRLWRNGVYSRRLLSVLELYRLQFQQQLANALVLEAARATQVLDHDRLVVSTVKNRIIPRELANAAGYRVSTLYLDNSPYGGDYFDSVITADGEMLLFMADSSYSGVDSALLLLELYTVLHTPGKKRHAPDILLETMNWIIATSRFPKKNAPAFCASLASSGEITYSSAGLNTMTTYDQETGQFISRETPGSPLGLDRTAQYEARTARLAPGSIGILHSNGLLSALSPGGKSYSFDRLKDIVRNGRNRSPSELTRLVYEDLNLFTDGKRQAGDISVILFKLQ